MNKNIIINKEVDDYSDEREEEIELGDDGDDENQKESILFCNDRLCTSIPEIYFDENSSLVYLFCNKNKNNEKHKYCLKIDEYLKNNILLSETKIKKIKRKPNNLTEEIKKDIDEMKNKIKYQKKHLEKITNDFNNLIHNIIDDFTFLLQNKLTSLIFQNKIINTYINCPDDTNANKNFQSLTNYMNSISISNYLVLEKFENNDNSKNINFSHTLKYKKK